MRALPRAQQADCRGTRRLIVEARRTVRESKTPTRRSSPVTTKEKTPARWGTPTPEPGRGKGGKPGKKQQESKLTKFMKSTPVLNRFLDGTLLLGDVVMLAATEVSSERIPYEAMPVLIGVTIVSWVIASAVLGDYKGEPPSSDNWYLSLLGPAFTAIVDSTMTWALSALLSLVVFSVLVSGAYLDSALLLDDLESVNLSPQLEVAVAALVTMSCWRGIAARLRYNS